MDLLDRIQYLMKINNLSASAFADKIDVQRSSMSHLLSGRNKPSLEFVNKVLVAFPKTSADWLINGKKEVIQQVLEENPPKSSSPEIKIEHTPTPTTNSDKQIKKIVIFYTDNTFEEIIK
jgi:transcriptional regulator with XRE-family HTH domain